MGKVQNVGTKSAFMQKKKSRDRLFVSTVMFFFGFFATFYKRYLNLVFM